MKNLLIILMVIAGTICILYPLWIVEPVIVTVVTIGLGLCFLAGILVGTLETNN